ncbi:MAG: head GIN domain-containing protein [Anaerolineae bacterium]
MKGKLLALGFAFLLVPVLAGCTLLPEVSITGSGRVVTQEFTLTGFDKVDVSHAFKVDVSQGDSFSVVIRIDDNLVQYLQVVKEGDTLKIGLKPGWEAIQPRTKQAEITMPELTGLSLSGASRGTITGFESAKSLSLDLSGASSLRGDIEAGNASFDLSGASDLTLTGSAQDVTIDARGGSSVDLGSFPVNDANVKASGASNVTVNASGKLDADASGGSQVYYLGSPTLGKVDTSGDSSVQPK